MARASENMDDTTGFTENSATVMALTDQTRDSTAVSVELAPSSIPSRPPFSVFTKFPELPVELRLAIWELSCSEPRYVALDVRKGNWPTDSRSTALTGVFFTNQESRQFALRKCIDITPTYNRCHLARRLPPRYDQYFDLSKDIATVDLVSMTLNKKQFTKWVRGSQRIVGKIKRLEVSSSPYHWDFLSFHWDESIQEDLMLFAALEELTFMIRTRWQNADSVRTLKQKIDLNWKLFVESLPSKPKLHIIVIG